MSISVHMKEYPKGPSNPYLWFLVPIKAPESLNNEYLDPYE